jgi:hypothetical protein
MRQASEGLSLRQELSALFLIQLSPKNFDRGVTFQIEMLTEIDRGLTASPKQAHETIITQLLSDTVCYHTLRPPTKEYIKVKH